jgi:signal transduction protein with GAF and PtsI domain
MTVAREGKSMSEVAFLHQEVLRLREENRELREEVEVLRKYVEAIQALADAIDQLKPNTEIMPLLDRILQSALIVINAKDGSLLVLDEETGELVFVLVHGEVDKSKLLGFRIPSGKGVAGWVAQQGKPAIIQSPRADLRFFPQIDDAFDFRTQSILAVPIIGRERVLGVIEILNKYADKPFTKADEALVVLLCRFAGELLSAIIEREEGGEEKADQGQEAAEPTEG